MADMGVVQKRKLVTCANWQRKVTTSISIIITTTTSTIFGIIITTSIEHPTAISECQALYDGVRDGPFISILCLLKVEMCLLDIFASPVEAGCNKVMSLLNLHWPPSWGVEPQTDAYADVDDTTVWFWPVSGPH